MNSTSPPQTPTTPKSFPHEVPGTTIPSAFATTSQPLAPQVRSSSSSTPRDANHNGQSMSTPLIRIPTKPRHHLSHRSPILQARRTLRQRHARSASYARLLSHQRRVHHHSIFAHLLLPLHPLVSVETGLAHPLFPRTLLAYQLLSHAQLDALAAYYHQLRPSYYSLGYPTAVVGRWWARDDEEEEAMDGVPMQRDQHYEALMMEAREALGIVERREGVELEVREVEEECMRERKRRRFGRFIGMKGCESPGREDEGVMSAVMEAWVEGEVERRMAEDSEREGWKEKGGW